MEPKIFRQKSEYMIGIVTSNGSMSQEMAALYWFAIIPQVATSNEVAALPNDTEITPLLFIVLAEMQRGRLLKKFGNP